MKSDLLHQFTTLRNSLVNERSSLEARLKAINAVLGVEIPTPSVGSGNRHASVAGGEIPTPSKTKRTMSAAARARISASQSARWAKIRGTKSAKATKATAPNRPAIRRAQNTMSLREVLLKLTASAARTKKELIEGLDKIGYKTTSKDPSNLISRFLYGKKAIFKNAGGKFSPK